MRSTSAERLACLLIGGAPFALCPAAYVPDLPGCIAAGDTIDETAQLMREAIEMHLEAMSENGQPIPRPTTVARDIEIGTAA